VKERQVTSEAFQSREVPQGCADRQQKHYVEKWKKEKGNEKCGRSFIPRE